MEEERERKATEEGKWRRERLRFPCDQQPEAKTEETKASIKWKERERWGGLKRSEERRTVICWAAEECWVSPQ